MIIVFIKFFHLYAEKSIIIKICSHINLDLQFQKLPIFLIIGHYAVLLLQFVLALIRSGPSRAGGHE